MPCRSDYMDPNGKEIAMSQVACLIDELNGRPKRQDYWDGYHPTVYCKEYDADAMVSKLCAALQKEDVTKFSLEMQIWWRDHQAADAARLQKEIDCKKTEAAKQAALAKLTKYERKLLGLDESS